jgi:hypothetical protein
MAVITLSPNRWSQLGSALGGGVSSGLLQAFLEQAKQQKEQEAIKQTTQDIIRLSQVLGIQIPQDFQPRTQTGLELAKQWIVQQTAPEETYTLSPGEVRYRGREKIAEVPQKEEYEIIDYWDRSGKKRQKRVPISQFNETVERVLESGGSLRPPSTPKPKWDEPFKVGSHWLQRDPETGRLHTLFKEDVEGMTPSQKAGEYERLRDQMARLMGYSDYVGLDPNIQQEVAQATETARNYYEQGMNIDQAINRTLKERRLQSTIEDIPKADRGILGTGIASNLNRTADTVRELINSGVDYKTVVNLLESKGWKGKDIAKILEETGTLEDAYSELRNQGMTPEQIKNLLGL